MSDFKESRVVAAKARVASAVLRRLRPAYAWRGRIISRRFGERSRFYDKKVQSAIETVLDFFEMWKYGPAFERMEFMVREAERVKRELEELSQFIEEEKPCQ